jgi:hypothetical protein
MADETAEVEAWLRESVAETVNLVFGGTGVAA